MKASYNPTESSIRDFFNLLKPRVMSLVIFTSITGLYLAPGEIHLFLALVAILCISIGSGAAGAINMWYDRDIDIIMNRTKSRPIPSGKVAPEEALNMGIFLSVLSVTLMALAINFLAAFLLAFTIFFYGYIYTVLLKRSTPQNIVIGGLAGALPPLIGWVSVTNKITIEPVLLTLIIFLWTPPHFWALSLYSTDDYTKANIPMMPNIVGAESTKKQIVIYTILLFISSSLFIFYGHSGPIYSIFSVILNLIFLVLAIKLNYDKQNKIAGKVFAFSILYLFALFLSLIIDKAWRI